MPPKVKISKEDIINTAIDIVREKGVEGINARSIATALECSTQPVFSNFATMDELYFELIKKAEELSRVYIQKEVESGKYPEYKANGMGYIRFAKEEKELFKLLYMRDRKGEDTSPDSTSFTEMVNMVSNNTGLEDMEARLFHFEIWSFVHGIAAMFATGYLDIDWELVSKMITDVFLGLKKQYGKE